MLPAVNGFTHDLPSTYVAAAILGLFGTVTDNLRQLFGAVMAVVAVNAVRPPSSHWVG